MMPLSTAEGAVAGPAVERERRPLPRWSRRRPRLVLYLLLPYLVTVPPVAAVAYVLAHRAVDRVATDLAGSAAVQEARTIAARLPLNGSAEELQARCAEEVRGSDRRLTVIAADGTVRCDTHAYALDMENHLHRPEIQDALRTGAGVDRRVSATIHVPMLYGAVRAGDGTSPSLVRVAIPIEVLARGFTEIDAIVWATSVFALVIGLVPAAWLSGRLGRRLERMTAFSRAVADGDFSGRLAIPQRDELGALEENLNEMATRLRDAFEDMQEDAEKVRGILRAMVEGVVVLSDAGEIILINRRAEELFDLPPGTESRGRPLVEMCRDPELQALLRETIGAVPTAVHEREIMLASTERRWVAVSVSPLRDARGAASGTVLVFHDISATKKLETMRRDFVANVSHELRTPLTAIRGYAETLLSGALEDGTRARKFLSVIDRHSERLSRLIDDLLTLSDLELGKTALKKELVQLPAVVDEVLDVVREKAQRGNVVVTKEIPASLPMLVADADRLQQVLINLTDNAVKYTRASGRVTIGARAIRDGDTSMVEVAVSDTGIGIPPEDLPRLTERFYRVDKARSRELGGTGLGLAIVKHIVQAHGGRLEIISTLESGTTVRFSIPAEQSS